MTEADIKKIISRGEGNNIEFKACQTELGSSVYETVCSFLNHSGGYIIIGVSDDCEILGLSDDSIEKYKKDFVHAVTNPHLFSPKAYVTPEEILVDGKKIIYIKVEEGIYVYSLKKRYYDRNNDADLDVTDQPALLANLFTRKNGQSYENRIVPFLELDELDKKTFDHCRLLISIRSDSHPWLKLSNEEILKSCGLINFDPITKKVGIKFAALLLFGSDESLANHLPGYRTEALFRNITFERYKQNKLEDTTRYDDRVTVRSNLIRAYDALMEFTYRHLPEKFYLDDKTTQRIDLRSNIFREIIANLCVHREYASNAAGLYEIFSDRVRTQNVTKFTSLLKMGTITIDELENYTKNPLLFKVFRELGWGEELGSGSRNIKKYAPLYYEKSVIEITNGESFVFSITYSDDKSVNVDLAPSVKVDLDSVKLNGDSVKPSSDSVNLSTDSVNLPNDDSAPAKLDIAVLEEKLFELLVKTEASTLSKTIKKRMIREMVLIHQANVLDRTTLIRELKYTTSQLKGDLQILRNCDLIVYLAKEKAYSISEIVRKELALLESPK